MSYNFKQLTTKELISFKENNKGLIIDVRSVDAYNGWKLQNELRGGHIKGAKSLPLKWTKYLDWIEIVRSKNILPEHQIIIYGYNSEDSEKVAKYFLNAGYKNIFLYNKFIEEWLANPELPIENLARYKQVVSADWIK